MIKKILVILCSLIICNSALSEKFKNKKEYYYGQYNENIIEIKGIEKKEYVLDVLDETNNTKVEIYTLYLENPINVFPKNGKDNDGLDVPEKNVKVLQISKDFKIEPNNCVILKGYLYHSFNAYHYKKVLISADSYRPCKD